MKQARYIAIFRLIEDSSADAKDKQKWYEEFQKYHKLR